MKPVRIEECVAVGEDTLEGVGLPAAGRDECLRRVARPERVVNRKVSLITAVRTNWWFIVSPGSALPLTLLSLQPVGGRPAGRAGSASARRAVVVAGALTQGKERNAGNAP